jgi:Lon protease-like protein
LFPLNTVLFPGGPLPLRIFETRYTDMVRRCMREQTGFGVVMIQADAVRGPETDSLAPTAETGTLANIVDFNQLPDGLLGITCIGADRFRVLRRWRAPDGLNLAEVIWLPPTPPQAVPASNAYLVDILRKLLPELGDVYQFVGTDFNDAGWVGCRLAEMLPVSLEDKQAWVEMNDPAARLDQLASLIRTPPN